MERVGGGGPKLFEARVEQFAEVDPCVVLPHIIVDHLVGLP